MGKYQINTYSLHTLSDYRAQSEFTARTHFLPLSVSLFPPLPLSLSFSTEKLLKEAFIIVSFLDGVRGMVIEPSPEQVALFSLWNWEIWWHMGASDLKLQYQQRAKTKTPWALENLIELWTFLTYFHPLRVSVSLSFSTCCSTLTVALPSLTSHPSSLSLPLSLPLSFFLRVPH